jgi:hypothetical protein
MKVKVAYTVDHEEVPKLIDDIIADCRASLRELSNFKFDVRNSDRTTEDVRSVQSRLDTVAGKLEDCLNLCLGYDSVVNP